ncbi:uncharacterized protein Dere_GG26931 [Drosophila erecta]|uniref:Uncharacterized protein n=2 Tax=Drosophila erecta TaxID=7220 RepID=A0A0Q5WKG5_DROER|nr:uncharacterized protein Dere_GG26931 [Drosophila erecta]
MRKYIELFVFLLILKTSLCLRRGYGVLVVAEEEDVILLDSLIYDQPNKLDEIKTNSVNILELDQLRKNLIEEEKQLKDCERKFENHISPGFWNTMKKIIGPKLEEKLKCLRTNNVEANAKTTSAKNEETNKTSSWDTIMNNWMDIPRQIIVYFSEN